MKSILLRAPTLSHSGYGTHARQVARWLFEKEKQYNLDISCETLPWGITPWILNDEYCNGLVGKIMSKTGNKKSFYDLTIQLQLPNEWNPKLGRFNIGMTAGVETDKCNPSWIDCINKMNLVIVPSNFVKNTFLNSGNVQVPIAIVPEAFSDEILEKEEKELDLNLTTSFNFLVFGQVTGNNPENDRKNLFYTIKWLCETFSEDKEVGVVVKTNVARNSKIDRQNTINLLTKLIMEVRKTENPKIYLLHGDMTDKEVASLYTHSKIKALVSLTRGEGFGLPLLEAAASGLPVISTDWSAHTEFLNLEKHIKIEYDLKQIHQSRIDNHIFIPGAKWAEPREQDAKSKLRKFKESSSLPKEWALNLQKQITKSYNFNSISKLYDEVLEGILK